jgi:hypothetical protein
MKPVKIDILRLSKIKSVSWDMVGIFLSKIKFQSPGWAQPSKVQRVYTHRIPLTHHKSGWKACYDFNKYPSEAY